MTNRVRMVLIALAVVVVALLVWFFLLDPIRDDIAATETQIEEEQTRLSQAQMKLAQAEATREEGRKNQARLLEMAKMMPTTEEVPSLLLQIQDLADQSGIRFIAVTPGNAQESEKADYRILPLNLEFSGTFFDISDFVWRAEQMVSGPGRLLAVKDLQLALGGAQEATGAGVSPELSVSMTMYAFLAGGESGVPVPVQPATVTTDETATTSDEQ